jgi:hypothetical protein
VDPASPLGGACHQPGRAGHRGVRVDHGADGCLLELLHRRPVVHVDTEGRDDGGDRNAQDQLELRVVVELPVLGARAAVAGTRRGERLGQKRPAALIDHSHLTSDVLNEKTCTEFCSE